MPPNPRLTRRRPTAKVELASASTSISMSRYLTPGVPTATPPVPGAQAWMDPDPRTLDLYAHGAWQQFRFRGNIVLCFNDHFGVLANANEPGHFATSGSIGTPATSLNKPARMRRILTGIAPGHQSIALHHSCLQTRRGSHPAAAGDRGSSPPLQLRVPDPRARSGQQLAAVPVHLDRHPKRCGEHGGWPERRAPGSSDRSGHRRHADLHPGRH